MDPRVASPDAWVLMTQTLNSLVLFVILAINTAVTFMIAHGVIPSLLLTEDVPLSIRSFRPYLYVLDAISAMAAVYAFYRAISLALVLMDQIYPRLTI